MEIEWKMDKQMNSSLDVVRVGLGTRIGLGMGMRMGMGVTFIGRGRIVRLCD